MTTLASRCAHTRAALPFVAAASILLVGCASDDAASDTKPAAAFTEQEQAVYSVILSQTFNASSYVLTNLSGGMDWPADEVADEAYCITREMEGVSGILGNLWAVNSTAQAIPTDLALGAPYSVIDQDTLSALVASDARDWNGFFARYPEAPGVLTISHASFDGNQGQALAMLRWLAGGLAGWRRYFLLQRSGDTWTIVDDVITVIS